MVRAPKIVPADRLFRKPCLPTLTEGLSLFPTLARGLGAQSHVAILRLVNQVLFAPTRAEPGSPQESDTARRRIHGAALDRLRAQPGHEMPLLDLELSGDVNRSAPCVTI